MAVVLAYDDLPEGSEIRREIREGRITITIPASDVSGPVRKEAYKATAFESAVITSVLLLTVAAFVWTALPFGRFPMERLAIAIGLITIVAAMTFALVWRIRATALVQELELTRRQTTLLDADEERLLIESNGPAGSYSHRLHRDEIRSIRSVEKRQRGTAVQAVEIALNQSPPLSIVPGRSEGELRWIVQSLRSVLGHRVEP